MKRLYRNMLEKKIFGVCAGLADYFDCDPTIIRIIFIAGFFCTASLFFWVYIIAAFIMPKN